MEQLIREYDLLYNELVSTAKKKSFSNKEVIKASQKLDECINKVMKKKMGV